MKRRMVKLTIAPLAVLILVLVFATIAGAHGSVDEEYSPPSYNFSQGFGGFDVGQSFITNSFDIVALDLPLCSGAVPDQVEVQLRDGTYDGPLLATSTVVVDAPICLFSLPAEDNPITHIDFASPASVVPGQTYVIRVHSTAPVGSSDVGWFGSDGNICWRPIS